MINIIEHLEHLVRRNDCVIVPGFGAFLAQYRSAMISADGSAFLPPVRDVAFNATINHNDGMLVTSLMRRHSLPYPAAMATLGDAVDRMSAALAGGERVSLGRLGSLVPQQEGSPVFYSAGVHSAANVFADCAEVPLAPVRARRLPGRRLPVLPAVEEEAERLSVTERLLGGLRQSWERGWGKVAAAVAVIAACYWVAVEGVGVGADGPALAGTSGVGMLASAPAEATSAAVTGTLHVALPDAAEATATVTVPSRATAVPETQALPGAGEKGVKAEKVEKASAPAKAAPATAERKSEQAAAAADPYAVPAKYLLVVASLPTVEQAGKFISDNPGDGLRIARMGKRCRVYAAASDDRDKMVAMQPGAARRYPGAWVCAAD